MHDFDVVERVDVPDYSSTGIYLRHRKTGLEVFHLLNDDPENLFAFAFRTPPIGSTGVAHILEHSVLCGSRNFPLKDPFIRLANQSVKTFLNAMTFPDKTVYPASSMVEADYFNLFSVYGDAVFFPLLGKWTFKQEAHRLEFDGVGKAAIQGVVYNEMKGNYSSFDSVAADAALKSLLPDTIYDVDSGGDPLEIPRLTYGQFKQFHEQQYHPGNCLLFLYGNIPTEKQLEFVEARFLQRFEDSTRFSEKPAGNLLDCHIKPFEHPPIIAAPAPAADDEGCTVTVNWLTGETAAHYMESVFLSEVLLGHDGSPLTRALLESGLGEDMSPNCGVELDIKYTTLTAGLRGVKKENAPKVEACIMGVLEKLCNEPVNQKDIDAAVMSVDFSNREIKRVNGPYSLVLMRRVLRSWVYGGSPWACLSPRSAFEPIKQALATDSGYVASLIKRLLLGNNHRSLVTVYPDSEYNTRREKEEAALMEELFAKTTAETIKKEQAELTRFQQTSDDEAKAACMPHLKPADLNVKIDHIQTEAVTAKNGVPLFTNREAVNGITYFTVAFPVDSLLPEDFPLLPFFASALTNTGFGGKNWADCSADIALVAGGFGASLFTSSIPDCACVDNANLTIGRSWLFVQCKMLSEKTDRALELLADCLNTADFSDTKRLKDLALESRNDLKSSIIPHGNGYALSRSSCALSKAKTIDEIWNGLSQLFTVQRLADGDMKQLTADLNRIKKTLLKAGAVIHVTSDDAGFAAVEKGIDFLIDRCVLLPPSSPQAVSKTGFAALTALPWRKTGSGAAELCVVLSQVGFAARTLPGSPYGTIESAHEAVFAHWLSNTLLWEQIRTVGGAYGAFAVPDNMEKAFSLVTYRDPKPFQSLDVFESCLQKAAATRFDVETLERAITGTYSCEVQPRSPSSRGFTGFIRKLYGITNEQRDAKIAAILAMTAVDMQRTAERLLSHCTADNPLAVLAGEEKNFLGLIADIPI